MVHCLALLPSIENKCSKKQSHKDRCVFNVYALPIWLVRGVIKKTLSVPSALTVSKCENPFFHWNLILWYSKHIVKGLKNVFLMPYTWLQMIIRGASLLQMIIQRGRALAVVGWKLPFFFCKTCFRTHMFIWGQTHHKKNHKCVCVEGVGGQPNSVFFTTPLEGSCQKNMDILWSGCP